MDVNKFLSMYVSNIGSIVEWLFILVLFLFLPILYFSFRKKPTDGGANLEGIEETLKKVLEQTRNQPAQTVVGNENQPATVATGAASSADEAVLKAEIAAREKRIGELTAKIADLEKLALSAAAPGGAGGEAAAPAASGGGDISGYESKIKDLEARLAEYEIIEDDIANLSLYKEENARLKDELAKLKAGGAAALSEIVTPKPEDIAKDLGLVAPEPTKSSEQEDQELSAALDQLNQDKPVVGGADIDAATEQEILGPLNDAIAKLGGEAGPADAAGSEPAPADDLVSQLANVMGGAAPEPMAASAAPAAAPAAAAPAPASGGPEALSSFDPDKIMAEADQLATQPVADVAEEGGDPGQKLIDEFENFMKDTKS